MTLAEESLSKFPAPWFGGKRKAAPTVWALLGDVPHYVEPFAGTLAVLLERPHLCNRKQWDEWCKRMRDAPRQRQRARAVPVDRSPTDRGPRMRRLVVLVLICLSLWAAIGAVVAWVAGAERLSAAVGAVAFFLAAAVLTVDGTRDTSRPGYPADRRNREAGQ